MGNLLFKTEKKHIKLICQKCNKPIYIDYKKDMLSKLRCVNCLLDDDGWNFRGEIRCINIIQK